MTDLPEVRRVPNGFSVDGAGPELLKDLLARYDFEVSRQSPDVWDTARPGLSRDEILNRLGDIDVVPPEELVVWWTWRNGHVEGRPIYAPQPQASLEQSIRLRSKALETGEYSHLGEPFVSQNWLHLDWQGHLIACCDPSNEPPVVMNHYAHDMVIPEYRGNLSLCTPVIMWLTAILTGWARYDSGRGHWGIEGWDSPPREVPGEWRMTGFFSGPVLP